jgi:acetoin utilization protein AcuB
MQTYVASVKESDRLAADQLLHWRRPRDIPVLDGDVLSGVVSVSDLLRACISRLQDSGEAASSETVDVRVGDVMVRDVITIDPTATLDEAAELMRYHEIAFLPMVDAGGRLIGAVTESDLVTATLR